MDRVLPGKACPILIGERPGLGADGGLHRRAGGDSHPQRDAVRVREGATAFATGESMASWVRTTGLYVIQEGDGKMLVSTAPGGAATGWIRTEIW